MEDLVSKKEQRIIFLVWNDDNVTEGDPDAGYFEQFDTIEDAVSSHGDSCEVFRAELKSIGIYKRSVKFVKVARRRRRKKK